MYLPLIPVGLQGVHAIAQHRNEEQREPGDRHRDQYLEQCRAPGLAEEFEYREQGQHHDADDGDRPCEVPLHTIIYIVEKGIPDIGRWLRRHEERRRANTKTPHGFQLLPPGGAFVQQRLEPCQLCLVQFRIQITGQQDFKFVLRVAHTLRLRVVIPPQADAKRPARFLPLLFIVPPPLRFYSLRPLAAFPAPASGSCAQHAAATSRSPAARQGSPQFHRKTDPSCGAGG